jgi:acetolactate synthase-1/2/3 large subunit
VNGGDQVAAVLERHGVRFLFTLCGGHISPILVEAKARGIRVIDVRDEASAVFAADAVARLSGIPGVAAVTAGPGVTNTITAVKNAQLAQSPVVILGGATGTLLKGRGSLQDIDQLALFEPHVKWAGTVNRVRDLAPALEHGFYVSRKDVPGPVFLECPVDLLYDEQTVRRLYVSMGAGKEPRGLAPRLLAWYLSHHVDRLFRGADRGKTKAPLPPPPQVPERRALRRAVRRISRAERPVLMVGSQALLATDQAREIASAVERLGIPVYLSGMGRGLLGVGHALQLRHQRRKALREADLVILAGVPCDFRLDYGRQINRKAILISSNLSEEDLYKNRRPTNAVQCDAGLFLIDLARIVEPRAMWSSWLERLRVRDEEREEQIAGLAAAETEFVNPIALCRAIDRVLPPDSILVADGGDFVATASYSLSPRGPLSWLDPGVFGTLGVGGGFALGAKLCRPSAEVWILYGDGSAAYSLAEFDTFARHRLPVIAVVGNDASWAQIAREQVVILGDDVGTVLRRSEYHKVAEGYGGKGLLLDREEKTAEVLAAARAEAAAGNPVLINVWIGKTDFRKGSISM